MAILYTLLGKGRDSNRNHSDNQNFPQVVFAIILLSLDVVVVKDNNNKDFYLIIRDVSVPISLYRGSRKMTSWSKGGEGSRFL